MKALLQLLQTSQDYKLSRHEIVEIHRELGEFEQALHVLQEMPEDEKSVRQRLLHRLIREKETAPMRYRT